MVISMENNNTAGTAPTEASPGVTAPTGTAPEETAQTEPEALAAGQPETEALTETAELPFGWTLPGGSRTLLGALGVTLALLAAVLALLLRRRRAKGAEKKKRRAAEAAGNPPAPAEAEPVRGRLAAACWQHIGKRDSQQDSCVCTDTAAYPVRGVLAAVADGMGGLSNGKVVSEALIRTLEDGFLRSDPKANGADLLLELAVILNAQINQLLRGQAKSGSTLAAVIVRNGMLHFFSVGDSRVYLYRGGGLIQLSREHIFQEALAVRALNGELPAGQIRRNRQSHALASYFGIGHIPALDRNDAGIRLVPGDKILIASDGVFGTLTSAQLEEALSREPEEAAAALGAGIEAANHPQQDNNTAIILQYQE